jgi:hypothetical protein
MEWRCESREISYLEFGVYYQLGSCSTSRKMFSIAARSKPGAWIKRRHLLENLRLKVMINMEQAKTFAFLAAGHRQPQPHWVSH